MQLPLRSINSSRSAYASISFIDTFFDSHNIFGASVVQAGVLAKVGGHTSVMLIYGHLECIRKLRASSIS